MASWNVRRRDSCTSSPHSPLSNRFFWMSSRMANRLQHAALVAVFTPSGQATRRVRAPVNASVRGKRAEERVPRTVGRLDGGESRDEGRKCLEGHDPDEEEKTGELVVLRIRRPRILPLYATTSSRTVHYS